MKKDRKSTDTNATAANKKLVLRKQSIRQLDDKELSVAAGGFEPPDGGCSQKRRHG
jgi:hypothetical protein